MLNILSKVMVLLGKYFGWNFVKKQLIKLAFQKNNIDLLGEIIDEWVDKEQRKSVDSGKLLRNNLILAFDFFIMKLKEADGVN